MAYLVDTNACIAIINYKPSSVRIRFEKAAEAKAEIWVSAVALAELWYGAEKSARRETNAERVRELLSGPVRVLPFGEDDARVAGSIRAILERKGRPIGPYDTLIAAQAFRNGMTLITSNVREFSRVQGLNWEDWAKA
jgi:tRNA(fMet)-specific endonuclease VapC